MRRSRCVRIIPCCASCIGRPTRRNRRRWRGPRALYNAADYDGAIAAAAARASAGDGLGCRSARRGARPPRTVSPQRRLDDLAAARDALNAIRPAVLSPRDQVDLLIGLGQSLYLTDLFGPAADLFDTALERGAPLSARDRAMLLDWWATAVDREAQAGTPERRLRLAAQIAARMEEELRRDPGSAPANYWLAVAARAAGDLDAAWDAAVAAWVRATLGPAAIGATIRHRSSRHASSHPRTRARAFGAGAGGRH